MSLSCPQAWQRTSYPRLARRAVWRFVSLFITNTSVNQLSFVVIDTIVCVRTMLLQQHLPALESFQCPQGPDIGFRPALHDVRAAPVEQTVEEPEAFKDVVPEILLEAPENDDEDLDAFV
jgi:hypothetical protein